MQSATAKLRQLVLTKSDASRNPISSLGGPIDGSVSPSEKTLNVVKPVYATIEYLPTSRCSHFEELPAGPLTQQMGDYEVILE